MSRDERMPSGLVNTIFAAVENRETACGTYVIPDDATRSPDKALRSSKGASPIFGGALFSRVAVIHCAVTARGWRIDGLDNGPKRKFGEIRLAMLTRIR